MGVDRAARWASPGADPRHRRGHGRAAAGLLVWAAALVAGCGESFVAGTGGGGEGGGGGAGGTGGGVAASRGERLAAAVCERTFTCCPPADLVEIFSPDGAANHTVSDHAGCRIFYRTTWETVYEPIIERAVQAGRLELDDAAFEGCLAAVSGADCAHLALEPPACDQMFVPRVEAGGACTSELECTTGKCDIPLGKEEGTCVAKPPPSQLGGRCAFTEDCAAGLHCHLGKCAAQKADGEGCTADDQCQSGQCVGEEKLAGKCEKLCEGGGPGPGPAPIDTLLEPLGGPITRANCARVFECCDGGERAEVLVLDPGSESVCLRALGVITAYTMVSLHNSLVQNKVAIDGAAIDACLSEYNAAGCGEGSTSPLFACPAGILGLLDDGEACATNAECASQRCAASGGSNRCAALPELGAGCLDVCAPGGYCSGGKCVAQKGLGEPCLADAECGEGRCYGAIGRTCTLVCDGP